MNQTFEVTLAGRDNIITDVVAAEVERIQEAGSGYNRDARAVIIMKSGRTIEVQEGRSEVRRRFNACSDGADKEIKQT